MKRAKLNFWVDSAAFLAFTILAATGVLLRYLLPPGSGKFTTLWGWDRHEWGHFHFWVALFLMVVLALHLILHWRWLICMIRGRKSEASGPRFALAVVGLTALGALVAAPFLTPVEHEVPSRLTTENTDGLGEGAHDIRGSMTLAEIAQVTRVPITVLVEELNLPPGVDLDTKLGQLRRQYEFSIADVRRIVESYRTNVED